MLVIYPYASVTYRRLAAKPTLTAAHGKESMRIASLFWNREQSRLRTFWRLLIGGVLALALLMTVIFALEWHLGWVTVL